MYPTLITFIFSKTERNNKNEKKTNTTNTMLQSY